LALNRALGLGLNESVTHSDVAQITGLFDAVGSRRFFAQVPPGPHQAEVASLLLEQGFRLHNNWVKLYRGLDDLRPGPAEEAVREIDQTDAQIFGDIVATAFGWPPVIGELVSRTVGRQGWRHYLAMRDEKPIATAAFYAWEDLAWIDFAATVEQFRGHGAQQWLLRRRLADARTMGCQGVVVEAAEPKPDKDAPSYRNLVRLGFQEMYRRPNYLFDFGGPPS
jgi:GNAT superfamily N-acetyltransferase